MGILDVNESLDFCDLKKIKDQRIFNAHLFSLPPLIIFIYQG